MTSLALWASTESRWGVPPRRAAVTAPPTRRIPPAPRRAGMVRDGVAVERGSAMAAARGVGAGCALTRVGRQ